MSKLLINRYYSDVDKVFQFGKTKNEGSISIAFYNLLNEYARRQHYEVIHQASCVGTHGKSVRPDGILKNAFGLNIGLWESKDEKDTIDDEIDVKQKKGYPFYNILFEDSQTAVLIQRGEEVMRAPVRDADKLHDIITEFICYKSDIIHNFEDALEKFKADIPYLVEALRKRIAEAGAANKTFVAASETFLELCKAEINPEITEADVREMMIQHILTSDIFNKIFDDPEFHRHNNIARELEKLIGTLFTYSERKNLLGQIEHYYDAINSAAAGIPDHHEKQKFLKVLYENFYKVYNPKAADRLGVVYTPNEIVQFMVESTDYLLLKHFGKTLADKNVEILDPATGTGTFITTIIDHLPNQSLAYKYKNEIHANEVAILPYYVANLNVEFTFKQKMGYYEEFKNLCFVDTLDNTDALAYGGKQHSIFGLSHENSERIKRQNKKKISVIIGNPPYNANQKSFYDENANRDYPIIDKRIKNTFIKESTAQKTKVYDMYARFYRWAMDRVDNNGVIAFITNRSFIDSRTFDGFRKIIQNEYSNAYIVDTKTDIRTTSEKIAGTTHNVFGIQTGVAIMFLVKINANKLPCQIEYAALEDIWRKEEKLEWLRTHKIENINFVNITPDNGNNWINNSNNNWDDLTNIISKSHTKTIFHKFANGVNTARDAWVYDFSDYNLINKIKYFITLYNNNLNEKKSIVSSAIKWSSTLKSNFNRNLKLLFDNKKIIKSFYRPFVQLNFYSEKILNDRLTENHYNYFGEFLNKQNKVICFTSYGKIFYTIGINKICDLHFTGDSLCLPLYRYNEKGERINNITDWGLEQFVTNYKDKKITKEDIFHYTYAVLHNPAYRKKYELNLKREFPRLPFYKDFWKWAAWGKELMDLHINYETVNPFPIKVHSHETKAETKRQKKIFAETQEPEVMYARQPKIKVKLKADKEAGIIEIDELTFLSGIPKEAWEYKLGNRSALEWILDQYKEKKPKDPTIAEKFNTYRFADYKDHVIDLLKRVCTVSVETMKVVREMEGEE